MWQRIDCLFRFSRQPFRLPREKFTAKMSFACMMIAIRNWVKRIDVDQFMLR
jgi:hypothetical protein